MGINNSVNAALLAIRTLGTFDQNLQKKMSDYQDRMKNDVEVKAKQLKEKGVDVYLEGMVKK